MHIWGRNFRRIASKAYPQTRKTRFFRYETELFAYLLDRLESRPTSLPVCRPSNRYSSDSARGLRHGGQFDAGGHIRSVVPGHGHVFQPAHRAVRFQKQDTYNPFCAVEVCFDVDVPHDGCILSLYQHKEWWMRPIWERMFSDIPERTQLLLWRSSDTRYAMLAVREGNIRADLGASDGRLRLRASTNAMGFTRLDGMLGVAAVSDDPYRAIHECVRAAVTRTHIRMRS